MPPAWWSNLAIVGIQVVYECDIVEVLIFDLVALLGFIFYNTFFSLVLLCNSPFVLLKYIVLPFPIDVVLYLSN